MRIASDSSTTPAALVAGALALFVAIDIGVRVGRFLPIAAALRRLAKRLGAGRLPRIDRWMAAQRTFDAVCVATRYYYRRRLDCLPKALATQCLLLAQGIDAEVCLGVKRYPFAGHAWVEVAGERFDDSPSALYRAGAYTVLQRF